MVGPGHHRRLEGGLSQTFSPVIDEKGHQYVLVLIDAFSRWVELYPTKGITADETAKCIFQHLGRFGAPERILTDRGTAFYNELVSELLHM